MGAIPRIYLHCPVVYVKFSKLFFRDMSFRFYHLHQAYPHAGHTDAVMLRSAAFRTFCESRSQLIQLFVLFYIHQRKMNFRNTGHYGSKAISEKA
jgi:hypothetical protein